MAELAVLRTAKQAMDEDLISQQDFDVVKIAFLKAQQIKAGLDAGFIRQSDYDKARDAYLHALDFSIMSTFPNTVQGQPYPLQPQNSQQQCHTKQQATMGRTASGHQLPQGTLAEVASDTAAAADRILGTNPRANGNVAYSPAAPAPAVEAPPARTGPSAFEAPVRAPSPKAVPAAAAAAPAAFNAMQSFGRSPANSGTGTPVTGTPRAAASGRDSGTGGLIDIPADLPQYAKGVTNGKVSMAGIGIREECVNLFMHMKTRSAYKWMTFKVDDSGRYVVPDRLGNKNATFQEFVACLPDGQCRYAAYDYEYTSPERGSFSKLVFVNWAPDGCNIRTKMMFASTKDFFKGFLDGVGAELQACERDEIREEDMRAKVGDSMTRK